MKLLTFCIMMLTAALAVAQRLVRPAGKGDILQFTLPSLDVYNVVVIN